MYPNLSKFLDADISLPSYFTLIAIGYLVALFLVWREGRRLRIDPDDVLDLGLWCLVFGVAGARILHVFADGFLMDYVHLCTDPMLVEGRDLLARPASELADLGVAGKLCAADAECKASLWGFKTVEELQAAEASGAINSCFSEPAGRDVGPICNEVTGLCHPEQDCFRWAKFWAGGLTFYGGFLGAIVFSIWYATKKRMLMLWAPPWTELPRTGALAGVPGLGGVAHFFKYLFKFPRGILAAADMTSAPIALAHSFGRMGCFLAGCCFGAVTQSPLGVSFPNGSAAFRLHRKDHYDALVSHYKDVGDWVSLPVHPTQLYEAGANFLIFVVLWFVVRKYKKFHGQVFACLLIAYGVSRFTLEFFRDDARGGWLGLSTSQLIAIPLFMVGVGLLIWGLRRATGRIDDGGNPPLGAALIASVHQPETVEWDGVQVSPVDGWEKELDRVEQKVSGRKRPDTGAASD